MFPSIYFMMPPEGDKVPFVKSLALRMAYAKDTNLSHVRRTVQFNGRTKMTFIETDLLLQ